MAALDFSDRPLNIDPSGPVLATSGFRGFCWNKPNNFWVIEF